MPFAFAVVCLSTIPISIGRPAREYQHNEGDEHSFLCGPESRATISLDHRNWATAGHRAKHRSATLRPHPYRHVGSVGVGATIDNSEAMFRQRHARPHTALALATLTLQILKTTLRTYTTNSRGVGRAGTLNRMCGTTGAQSWEGYANYGEVFPHNRTAQGYARESDSVNSLVGLLRFFFHSVQESTRPAMSWRNETPLRSMPARPNHRRWPAPDLAIMQSR